MEIDIRVVSSFALACNYCLGGIELCLFSHVSTYVVFDALGYSPGDTRIEAGQALQ
jgi:hypothetical protein